MLVLILTSNKVLAQREGKVDTDIKLNIKVPEYAEIGQKIRVVYVLQSPTKIEDNQSVYNFLDKAASKIKDIEILYGPALTTSSSVTTVKGKRTVMYTYEYTYIMSPLRKGNHTIPKWEVTIDGKKYISNTPLIKVADNEKEERKTQKSQKDKRSKDEKIDAFVKMNISKTNLGTSDTLSIVYKLYSTTEPARIANIDMPKNRDLYIQRAYPSEEVKEETIKGKKYKIYEILRLIVQPRNTGSKKLQDGIITVEYDIPTGRTVRNFWGEEFEQVTNKQLTLPLEGATVSVMNLVGI